MSDTENIEWEEVESATLAQNKGVRTTYEKYGV